MSALNKTFVVAYLDFTTTYSAVLQGQLDAVYTNPSIFACLEAQAGVNAIASIQTLRSAATAPYAKTPQSKFGANFFALSNRSDINLLADIAGKKLEGADVTGLGAGQAQWKEITARGLSFWNLPSAMIFSHNQNSVALDVYNGYADVGMVRTDLLEGLQSPACRVSASTPACFPAGTFKILEPKPAVPGFQFNSSTELYPEWPVATLAHVDVPTQKALARALFALDYTQDPQNYTKGASISTFTPPLAYYSLRDMQQSLGWIVNGSCITSTNTYDTIVCSTGSYKKSPALVNSSCAALSLTCKPGYDCMCAPCVPVPATELSVVFTASPGAAPSAPCAKLQTCARAVQNSGVTATLVDNWAGAARAALGAPPVGAVAFKFHGSSLGADSPWVNASAAAAAAGGGWSVSLATPVVGFALLEASVGGVALPSSPYVLSVVAPSCPGANSAPDPQGVCLCAATYRLAGNGVDCQPPPGLDVGAAAGGAAAGFVALVALLSALAAVQRHRHEGAWRIPLEDVQFANPPEVLGRGTFGLVVKGTYRGTTVALKRTLPPDEEKAAKGGDDVHASHAGGAAHGTARAQFDLQILPEQPSRDAPPSSMSQGGSFRLAPLSGAVRTSAPRGSARSRASVAGHQSGGSDIVQIVLARPLPPTPMPRAEALSINILDSVASPVESMAPVPTSGCSSGGSIFSALRSRRQRATLRADFVREMRMVVHLRHPNITTVLGAVLQRGSEPILVMECMSHGSLYDLLHNETVPLDADIVLPIISDVISGLSFLHAASPPVTHNDLKSANILVDASFRAKVSDFGLSGKSRATGGQPGTPLWMAPELLRRTSGTTTATDVYAFGVTLCEIFSRQDPYAGQDFRAVMTDLVRGPSDGGHPLRRPDVSESVPPLFASLMQRCWAEKPGERPSMAAVALEIKEACLGEEVASVTSALLAAKQSSHGDRALLHSVFPPAVAAALAAGRRVEPQHFDCVTVFFSDIVGFTDLSAKMSARKVMDMLDRLYHEFDSLTQQHGLYKVETIGDAYMVCGALRDGQEDDHVARVAAFALDAVEAAAALPVDRSDPGAGFVAVRAGFHCGPVIASVVGSATPRYCMFGDTVNTASRMESISLPGRVNLSEDAAVLLKQQLPGAVLTSRGLVAIKGKGNQLLSWLESVPGTEQQPWRVEAVLPAPRLSEEA